MYYATKGEDKFVDMQFYLAVLEIDYFILYKENNQINNSLFSVVY